MKNSFSLFSNGKHDTSGELLLAGDVGGTKTLLSLCRFNGSTIHIIAEQKFPSKEYKSLTAVIKEFLSDKEKPDVISIAVAGPVTKGQVNLTNLKWQVGEKEIGKQVGVEEVFLLNDLEATAYGLAELNEKDFMIIHEGDESAGGNIAIIAPGTGLGEAGLYWDGEVYHPFASEGGHCDFAPRTDEDIELYKYLRRNFGHVSWERCISGQGIVNIHSYVKDYRKQMQADALNIPLDVDAATFISEHALAGDDPASKESIDWFLRFLAYESANLALKIKATGGLFIAGGIPPKLRALIKPAEFMFFFKQSGRLNALLEEIPIRLVLNERTALLGAMRRGRFHNKQVVVDKIDS